MSWSGALAGMACGDAPTFRPRRYRPVKAVDAQTRATVMPSFPPPAPTGSARTPAAPALSSTTRRHAMPGTHVRGWCHPLAPQPTGHRASLRQAASPRRPTVSTLASTPAPGGFRAQGAASLLDVSRRILRATRAPKSASFASPTSRLHAAHTIRGGETSVRVRAREHRAPLRRRFQAPPRLPRASSAPRPSAQARGAVRPAMGPALNKRATRGATPLLTDAWRIPLVDAV